MDRSIPPAVAALFTHFGVPVWTMAQLYPTREQQVPDVEWIEMCGRTGLTAVCKNPTMRYVDRERQAIRDYDAIVISLGSTQLGRYAQAAVLGRHVANMRRWAQDPDCGLWRIYHNTHRRDL